MNRRRYCRSVYTRAWQSLPEPQSAYSYFNRASDEEVVDDMMARVRPSGGALECKQSTVSLQFNEQAELAESAIVGGVISSIANFGDEGEESRWIQRNIKCRECRVFVPVENDSSDDEAVYIFSKNAPGHHEPNTLTKKMEGGQIGSPWPALNAGGSQTEPLIPKTKRKRSRAGNDRKCQCGYYLSEHRDPDGAKRNGLQHGQGEWNHKTHTSPLPTNAFGEIEFVGYGDKVAKYVRVDTETEMQKAKQLMMDKWGMERPNLLISVTGGAKNFQMRGRLKDAFRRGLMKAALSTGAWIVTGGTNAGVMKHVGEAVRDYGLTADGRVICIGIAPWGCVQNREELTCEGTMVTGKWPAMYRIQGEQKSKQSFLDPNHTHFILVDNGTQRRFATEIEFRAKLEKEISQLTTSTGHDAVRVPVALLVLEGGPGTLNTVVNAIKNNTPAIVIKGSGKCADVLAYAAQNISEIEVETKDEDGNVKKEMVVEVDEKLRTNIKTMVEQAFSEKGAVQHAQWVEECIRKPHLISVYEMESTTGSTGVDVAILKALLKANRDQVMDQLKLALAWNRIDIAKSEIFTDERPWPTGLLDDMMMSAIQLNRVDFVDLFLDNGVSLKDFLTIKRLLKLYNDIPNKNCLLYTLLTKVKHSQHTDFSLKDVGTLLQDLLGDYFQPDYLELDDQQTDGGYRAHDQNIPMSSVNGETKGANGDMKLARPAQDLFLYAVLRNQQDLAKLFWREGNESTAAALVANSLLKAMRNFTDDTDLKQRLQNSADEFEDLAIGVLNSCYTHDEQKAQDLLIREMNNWGKATCVLIAVQADNKRFISQTACQSLLHSIWMGKMSQDNGLIRLIPSMFVFPLILAIVKFRDEERAPSELFTSRNAIKGVETSQLLKREPTQMTLKREATQSSLKVQVETAEAAAEARFRPDGDSDKHKGISACDKVKLFYTAPVVIFILNCISYLVFLGLYSYILVVQLSSDFHFLEGILIFWVATIFVEEIRQLVTNYAHSVKSKLVTYLTDSWNLLDIVTIILFAVGMLLRFIPNTTCFDLARVVLSINLVSFFFRILHIFSVNKELGPKLVMIRRMIRDLMWFVMILMVFIGAYAIASEAILYPETELSWKLLYHLPRKAYWQIYGELFLEEIEGTGTCTNDPALYSGYNEQRCPSAIGKYLVPVLMGVYVLMTNVLLLNLLIAMFSYTFQMVQDNTDTHWYFQRFNLIHEYYERPWLPPPFIIFIHIYMLFMWCKRHCNHRPLSSDFRKRFDNLQDEKKLVQWENILADTYLTKVEAREADSVDGRVKVMMHRLEQLQTKLDDLIESQSHSAGATTVLHTAASAMVETTAPAPQPLPTKQVIQMPPQLDQRMGSLEEKMASTFRALNWIIQAMEASDMTCSVTPPELVSPKKHKDVEKRREKERQKDLRDQVSKQLERRHKLHVVSRSPIYPNSFICRYPVPDEKVHWEVSYEEYDPVSYTSEAILAKPSYADEIDLLNIPIEHRTGRITFNDFDKKARISRISFEGQYGVKEGLPLNPRGRTGVEGRGMLGRWGPNIAGDPLVTRWKCDAQGMPVLVDGKQVLEFIAVKRSDNKMWAIPGAISLPGEQPWDILSKYFTLEAFGSLMDDPEAKAAIESKLQMLSEKGVTLYQGYADDARNTDNAWLETRVINYHDDTGKIFQHFDFRAGTGTSAVSWLTVSSKIALHGSHLYFLKLAAEKHNAMF